MRVETTVMSVSWIPSEAISGTTKLPFEMGVTHYDDPPPDRIDDIDALHREGKFRFANVLRAWAEIDDGKIVDVGQEGRGLMSATLVKLAGREIAFQPTAFPDLLTAPQWDPRTGLVARFVGTTGGRPGVPAPRRVSHPPFVQLKGPSVWSTLGVTINADGSSAFELVGASPFPRHWLYVDGLLTAKAGLIDFDEWYAHAFGLHSPWGEEDSPAMVATVESALERQLSATIMRAGRKPALRTLKKGERLVEQGDAGAELFLVLDGMLDVTVDGKEVAELGPGAILGERASLEQGVRTATLTALTPVRVAVAAASDIDLDALERLAADHRREHDREGLVGLDGVVRDMEGERVAVPDKRVTIDDVVGEVRDGMTIGIGGWGSRRKPMALVRALARSSVRDLTVVSYGGPDVGVLCRAGKVRKVVYAFVSLDSIPLEPHFRNARQAGAVRTMELDEGMFLLGLQAAAWRVPFLPTRVGLGSDVMRLNPELRTVRSPYADDDELVAMPALTLDVALIHMNRGDQGGSGQYLGIDPYFDDLICMAAQRRFMSVERIVDTEEFLNVGPPQSVRINRLMVDGVVETPNGAHFTSCPPDYERDEAFQREYAATAKSDEAWDAFQFKYLDVDEAGYQAAVAGSSR